MLDMSVADGAQTVFLFPGQGSQHHQMARELFEHAPDFRDLMLELDWDYARKEGQSLLECLFGAPARVPLDDIRISHPLLVILEYALATTLYRRGVRPSLLIASSAGEFAAHAFAGRMSIERALAMVSHQAHCAVEQVAPGFLVAVMEPPEFYSDHPEVQALAHLAGLTFPGSILLAGKRSVWDALEALLKARGSVYQLLPVRVPFHSPLVDPMRDAWIAPFAGDTMRPGWVPVLGQCPAPVASLGYAQALWQVVRRPLDFPAVLRGLDRRCAMRFIDVGPAGTLANWVRHGAGQAAAWQTVALLSPWGGDLRRFRKVCGVDARSARVSAGVLP